MRVMTSLPKRNLNHVSPAAQAAEAAGFDSIATMENSNDPFLPLAIAAAASLAAATAAAVGPLRARHGDSHDREAAAGARARVGGLHSAERRRGALAWARCRPAGAGAGPARAADADGTRRRASRHVVVDASRLARI